ncbi:Carboxylic acid transporter protein [Spathaspora sp. JA1]|nr:Carboxylic acid transporter protein [Spathaspora sp. JA1]
MTSDSSINPVDVNKTNKHVIQPPTFTWPAIRTYVTTRFSSLWVGKEERALYSWNEILNPFQPLVEMNLHQWNFFLLGFLAWTWDALDFFATSLNLSNIAKEFDVTVKDVSWGITLVLMLRTVGAVIFGAIGDTRGRKWPYIINLFSLIVIQLGTGFVTTYQQFLGLRALFGVAMGGIFGICAAEALGDAPKKARGVLSGIFQEGYAFGYLLAVIFQRALVDTTPHGWRSFFWFSAGPPVLLIIWRFFTPETDSYQRQRAQFQEGATDKDSKVKEFKSQAKAALKQYWLIIIYLILMMTGFNFSSHGSQDLYPTMLTTQYGYGANASTVVNVCANLGALVGGIIIGHLSTFIGRRTAILSANIITCAFIYPWAFRPMWVTAFFMQFGVQGAWSVVPIHLSELSPPQFRAFVAGVSYQLGNLVSSASSTIEATISERFIINAEKGIYDYGKTMAIFMAAVMVYLTFVVFFGPENRGADLGSETSEVYIEDYEVHEKTNIKETEIKTKIQEIHTIAAISMTLNSGISPVEKDKHVIQPPTFTWPAIRTYFTTRFSSLWVGKEERALYSWNEILNPFQPLVELNLHQWSFFFLGFFAWTWDALDFFTTALNLSNIAKEFDVTVKDVSWGITLVLMLRPVGAIIFGAFGDTVGRKWPYIANLFLLVVIQLGTGFVTNFKQFMGLRALFGVAMGGIFGICAAEALSDAPQRARGVLSGIFQEGYAFGYLLAVIFQRALVDTTPHGWRSFFWFSAGPPVLLIIWRFFTPETDSYQRLRAQFQEGAANKDSKVKEFKSQAKASLKQYWLIIIYLILMMSGLNFSAHGSQDLFPTMLTKQYGLDPDASTVVNVCANLGALIGGIIIGHLSTYIGRRTAILSANIITSAFIYPWAFKPSGVTAFFMQFGVQGAWSVVPIHLSELSPPQFRAFVSGVTYQIGNLISSASATIEATLGERFPIDPANEVYDYAKTMAIFTGAVTVYLIIVMLLGPENRGADLSGGSDSYVEDGQADDSEDEKSDNNKTEIKTKVQEV